MDRLGSRTDPLLKSESYQYDLNGNPVFFGDRKVPATTHIYDALNRRTAITYADSSSTTYTYDAGNRLTQINDSIAGPESLMRTSRQLPALVRMPTADIDQRFLRSNDHVTTV